MKLIHLSDLHMGKRVNEFSMLEDQKYILNQMLSVVKREEPEGVILAGDIYDKPVPPVEAVEVFDGFLTELVHMGVKVFIISGNHDSPERLSFGAHLMQETGVYVSPVYRGAAGSIRLRDEYGSVRVHLLPFLKPSSVRKAFPEEPVHSYQDAVKTAVSQIEVDPSERNILVAHQFVTGAVSCESEELAVGGVDQIDAAIFGPFDYVALGHLHSPQHVIRETVRYCGTPLKYSFSEAGQTKSVTVVELKEKGNISVSTVPLLPLRDMRKLRGTYQELMTLSSYQDTAREDYIHITLTDEEDVIDGMQKLRTVYPNIMRLEYDNKRTRLHQNIDAVEYVEEKSEQQIFEEFYQLQNNSPMSREQTEFLERLLQKIREHDTF